MNKYVVTYVPMGSEDLSVEEFDNYDDAIKFVESTDNKAVIIRVEGLVETSKVEIEWYT